MIKISAPSIQKNSRTLSSYRRIALLIEYILNKIGSMYKQAIKFIIIIAIPILNSLTLNAKTVDIGISLGVNYANISSLYSGWGFAADIGASFYQEKRFGFLVNINYLQVSAQSAVILGTSTAVSGPAYIADITPNVNFDFSNNRHSFGIGYAYGNTSYSSQTNNPTAVSGVAITGKDYWKNGMFDLVQIFLLKDSQATYSSENIIMITIGYEFR